MDSEKALKRIRYPESQFGDYSDCDGTVRFYSRVNAMLRPDAVVLDVGCGRGAYLEDVVDYRRRLRVLRGKCRRVIGIDVDPAGHDNRALDEFRLLEGNRWPLVDGMVDLVVSDYVLEHVTQPAAFFEECARVLKPGGCLCLRTPNRLGYVALAAQCVPNRLHAAVLRWIGKRRGAEDVFPTVYRCNTRRAIRRMLAAHGFDGYVYAYEDEPTYLAFSRIAYTIGDLWRSILPPLFRGNLFVFARLARADSRCVSKAA